MTHFFTHRADVRVSHSVDMTHGSMFGKIVLFTLPLLFSGILQLLYNAADMVVVGRYAAHANAALAAVGACGALINLIINLFLGLAVGAGVTLAQDIGAGRSAAAQQVVHTAVLVSAIGGVAVGVFGFFAAKPLLTLMGTPDDVLVEAVPYMRAYFTGIPACMVYNYAAALLRAKGDTVHPLVFLALSGLLNVALNLVMVCGLKYGAVGVGIATAVSQVAAMVMVLVYLCRQTDCCRLQWRQLRIHGGSLRRILRIGIPAGLQGMFFSLSNVLIQSTVNTYGEVIMAGNTAAANLEGFVFTSMNAVTQAAMTFVGQNVGAGEPTRVRRAALQCLAIVCGVGLVMGNTFYLCGGALLSLYRPGESAVIAAGLQRMAPYCTCGAMDTGSGILRGMGQSTLSMVVTLLGSCALRIVWIYTVCPLSPEIQVLYLSYPVSWTLTAAVLCLCCIRTYRKSIQSRAIKRKQPV